jgi:hypothetical protein
MYWNDYNSLSLEGQHIPINAAEVQAIEQLLLRIVCLIEGFKPWPNGSLLNKEDQWQLSEYMMPIMHAAVCGTYIHCPMKIQSC